MIGRAGRRSLIGLTTLALVLVGCGPSQGAGTRAVGVTMSDDMRYEPTAFEFMAGETIRFEVRNEGQIRHEFFIGDTAAHEDHAAEMRDAGGSPHGHDDPASLTVEPGSTGTLTFSFIEPGRLFVGCHEPGHYEAGMVAPMTIHPAP